MKCKQIFLILILLCCALATAQVPHELSFQAVMRTPDGLLLKNRTVSVRASIIQRGMPDSVAQMLTLKVETNDYGLLAADLDFSSNQIKWDSDQLFLFMEFDPDGGESYSIATKQQLVSVPYALNALMVDSIYNFHWEEKQVLSMGHDTIYLTGGSWVKLPPRFSGDYNDLTNRPTNISTFTNDAGYLLSEVQVISISGRRVFLTGGSYVDIPYGFVGNYNNLYNKPTIPTAVSDLNNDAGYLTGESQIIWINGNTIFLTGGSYVQLPPYVEYQGLGDVTVLGNSAGNHQLKDLVDPTDSLDAITLKYMMEQLLLMSSDTAQRGNVYTVNTCDRYLWNGTFYTQSGTYTYSYPNSDGFYVNDTLILTIRNGYYQGQHVQTPTTYTWHGTEYSSSGTYTYEFLNDQGCTSVDTLYFHVVSGTDCASHRQWWDTSSVTACGTYQWYGQVIRFEGEYEHDLGNIADNGCDSIVHVYVSLLSVPRQDTTIRSATAIQWRGYTCVPEGDFGDTLSAANGCDSIFTLHLMNGGDRGIGAVPGVYSVSPTQKVKFAQGNLQYQSSSDRWKFAEHQYDRSAIECLADYYPSWADLFGWGTSGYHAPGDTLNQYYHPWDRISQSAQPGSDAYQYNLYGYGPSLNQQDINMTGNSKNYDWCAYNSVMNGGNGGDLWRTLTKDEWEYLLRGRPNASSLCGFSRIHEYVNNREFNVSGFVFLSDNFVLPQGLNFNPQTSNSWGNVYTRADWARMEAAGAVFLPIATDFAIYWSSTSDGPGNAYGFSFSESDTALAAYNRSEGYFVRPVQDYLPGVGECSCTYFDTNVISTGAVTWNGQTYTQSGDYFNIIDNAAGCDSIITFSLILIEPGVLNGYFSVSDTHQVSFAKGNLQYKASADIWRFANRQYEYFGDQNKFKSDTYIGWTDLFYWATSGYHDSTDALNTGYQPYSTDNNALYGPSVNMSDWNIINTSANYDWGVYNTIPNGGNAPGSFRALTRDEINYILYSRPNCYNLRLYGIVHGVNGIILLPDDWISPTGVTLDFSCNYNMYDYQHNIFDDSQWNAMENAGAVFLPAAGVEEWSMTPVFTGEFGIYWSSNRYTQGDLGVWTNMAFTFAFGLRDRYNWYGMGGYDWSTNIMCSVRLVQDR